MLLSSPSSGRQTALKLEIQQEKKGIYWDKLLKEGRNQYLEKMSLMNDLDPYEVPNKLWTPANVTSTKQC